jgi:hypothetical protein
MGPQPELPSSGLTSASTNCGHCQPALTRLPARPAILKTSAVCERARKKSSFCRESGVAPELGVLRLYSARSTGDLDFQNSARSRRALAPTDF